MKYLKVWTDFENVLSPLKEDEIGRLFLLMIRYARDGSEPVGFVGNEGFVWPAAKRDIDIAMERNEVCRQNGLRGGRPKTKENQTEPNETKENQTEPNESKGKLTRQDKTGQDKKIQDKKERFSPPTVEEVETYCRERKNSVNAQRFVDFYTSKGWQVGKNPMKDWKACVRTWEQRDERMPDVKPVKRVIAQEYEQRDYSGVQDEIMDDLAREMEAFKREVG